MDVFRRRLYSNVVDENGRTALHEACDTSDRFTVQKVRECLAANMNPNVRCMQNCTPMHGTTYISEVFTLLINAGGCVDVADKYGIQPIHTARTLDIVKILVSAGANPLTSCYQYKTVLLDHRDSRIVEYFLTFGVDVNVKTWSGRNALFYQSDPTVVQKMLDMGADVGCVDDFGYTAYDITVSRVKCLLAMNGCMSRRLAEEFKFLHFLCLLI